MKYCGVKNDHFADKGETHQKDGYDYSNCDTNFRFYWVEQKYAELQDRGNLSLALIPYRSLDTLQQFISQGIKQITPLSNKKLIE